MKIKNIAWKKLATISIVFFAGVYSGRIIEGIRQSEKPIGKTNEQQQNQTDANYYYATQERALTSFDNGVPVYTEWSPVSDYEQVTDKTMVFVNDTTKVYLKNINSDEAAIELSQGLSIQKGILYIGGEKRMKLSKMNNNDKLKDAVNKNLVQYQERSWNEDKEMWSDWSKRYFVDSKTNLKNTVDTQYRIILYTDQATKQVKWFNLSALKDSSFHDSSLYEGDEAVPMDMSDYNPDDPSHVPYDAPIYDGEAGERYINPMLPNPSYGR